jgi:YesN/AraC family two-component response regulator
MLKINFKKRKLLFYWLISYSTVLLIAVSIISIIYNRTERTIENEIDRANVLHLSKIQTTGDLRLNDMRNISVLVGTDGRVISLANKKMGFNAENQLDIISVRDFLRTIKLSNGFIDQIYVYFKNTDSAISNDTHVYGDLAYKLFNGDKTITYDQWKAIVNRRYQGRFVNNFMINDEDVKSEAVSFILSLPMEAVNNPTANIIIQFSRDKFAETLRSVARENQNTIILEYDGKVIVSTGMESNAYMKNYLQPKEKSGTFYEYINNEKSVVSYINSDISGYRYVSIMPYSVYMEKVINTRRLVWTISAFFIVIGAIGVQFLVRKNYKPIKNIIESISKKLEMSQENQGDELSFIQSAFYNVLDENDKIHKKMKENENALKISFLERLLKGNFDEDKITDTVLSEFNFNFESQDFAVMLLVMEEYENKTDVQEELYETRLLNFVITNVLEELINQCNRGMMVELDSCTYACIINISNNEKDHLQCKREIIEAIEKAQEFIKQHFKISFSAALSKVYSTLGGISFAYRDALNAMNHRVFMGKNSIICSQDVAGFNNFYEYSVETEYKLMNIIREGNFPNAKKIVEQIFEDNFNNLSLTVESGECLVFDLLGTLIKIVDDNDVMEKLQPISRLKKCSTIQGIKLEIISLLEYICDYFLKKNKTKAEFKVSVDIIEYIKDNYKDENLSVAMIGDHFNMTSNYLSKIFKNEVEEGLHDFIERIRIEKAKELILSEKINISEVAKEVGYSNSKTFIRVFKKIEGTTPGKYRDLATIE